MLRLTLPYALFSTALGAGYNYFSASLAKLPFARAVSRTPFESFASASTASHFYGGVANLPSTSFDTASSPAISCPTALFGTSDAFYSGIVSKRVVQMTTA